MITPRRVADALGVSESSVKRWSDRGLLPSKTTAGGHRRLDVAQVLRFAREHNYKVEKPELLGLPRRVAASGAVGGELEVPFFEALSNGDVRSCRNLLVELFVRGQPLTDIFDKTVRSAMHQVGHGWECGEIGVFQEHRSVEIMHMALHDLRDLLPTAPESAPTALCATLAGDPYTIAPTLAELTLAETGWRVINLGPNHPASSLTDAMTSFKPRLVCVSISFVADRKQLNRDFEQLAEHARQLGVAVAVGGQAATPELRETIRYTAYCDNMRELRNFASDLVAANR